MTVKRFQDLIEWTHALHAHLASCLERCAPLHEDQRCQWLLSYLAAREHALAKLIAGFLEHADSKALGSWIYEHLRHEPIDPDEACDEAYAEMTFDQIETTVMRLHNQALDLFEDLRSRAEIPEARELLEQLSSMELHEARLLAQQANRIRDL